MAEQTMISALEETQGWISTLLIDLIVCRTWGKGRRKGKTVSLLRYVTWCSLMVVDELMINLVVVAEAHPVTLYLGLPSFFFYFFLIVV